MSPERRAEILAFSQEQAARLEVRGRVRQDLGRYVGEIYDREGITPDDMADILSELAKDQISLR